MSETAQVEIDDCWNRIGVWGRARPRCAELERHIHCYNCEVFQAAGHRLRDRPLPEGYQAEWTEIVGNRKAERELDGLAAVVFRVGREWLALPAKVVDEIVEVRPVHSLPHRPSPVLQGLVNIRGKLCLCVSLAALLGIEADAEAPRQGRGTRGAYPRLLAVRDESQSFVFAADEVLGTHRYGEGDLQSLPTTLSAALERYSAGALLVGERHVGVLAPDLLFYAFSRSLA